MSDYKLLPCPFCGSKELRIYNFGQYDNEVYIKCVMCFGQISGQGKEYAVERWNTRAQLSHQKEMEEQK